MKIWLDDLRPAPEGYTWCHSVNKAKRTILYANEPVGLIDCDHDLGDYALAETASNFWTDWQRQSGIIPSACTQ